MTGEPTQGLLKETVHYNPETGVFAWRERPASHFRSARTADAWNAINAGKECGHVTGSTRRGFYRVFNFYSRRFPAHRLAFLYMLGRLPARHVDHIDGDSLNNAWGNLREVAPHENALNLGISANNTSGVTGVYWSKAAQRWYARIKINREDKHLGSFINKNDAIKARRAAERTYKFHPNHGRRKALTTRKRYATYSAEAEK